MAKSSSFQQDMWVCHVNVRTFFTCLLSNWKNSHCYLNFVSLLKMYGNCMICDNIVLKWFFASDRKKCLKVHNDEQCNSKYATHFAFLSSAGYKTVRTDIYAFSVEPTKIITIYLHMIVYDVEISAYHFMKCCMYIFWGCSTSWEPLVQNTAQLFQIGI